MKGRERLFVVQNNNIYMPVEPHFTIHSPERLRYAFLGPGYTSAKNAALLMPSDTLVLARLHGRC